MRTAYYTLRSTEHVSLDSDRRAGTTAARCGATVEMLLWIEYYGWGFTELVVTPTVSETDIPGSRQESRRFRLGRLALVS